MKKLTAVCFFGTYDKNYTSNKLILQGLKQNGIHIVEVNAHIPVTRLDSQKDMTWFHLIRRIWNKNKILSEIIHHWSEIKKCQVIYVGYPGHFDVFFAFIVAKLTGAKLIFNPLLIIYIGFAEEQGILKKSSLLGQGIKFAEQTVYRLCDMVFADTPFQQQFLQRDLAVPESKLRVLAIGADDQYYRYTPYTNKSKKINVVYYGLYSPIHGVEYIIEAAKKLKNDPDITFTMVGNGNTFEKNYKKAQQLQLKNVHFFHDTPVEKHPAIIEQADIFLGFLQKHPSVERIIPNKVYQGLALGRVVLTADAPVTRSMFSHKENMYFVKPANAQALVDALVELKENPSLRMKIAKNGYTLFKQEFNPQAVGKKLITFTEEIL